MELKIHVLGREAVGLKSCQTGHLWGRVIKTEESSDFTLNATFMCYIIDLSPLSGPAKVGLVYVALVKQAHVLHEGDPAGEEAEVFGTALDCLLNGPAAAGHVDHIFPSSLALWMDQ